MSRLPGWTRGPRVEIRELLGELANMGKTIFFSSHILADVEDVCSHIGILEAGEIIMQGSIDELKLELMAHREIIITVMDQAAAEAVTALVSGSGHVVAAEIITPKKRTGARSLSISPAPMKNWAL